MHQLPLLQFQNQETRNSYINSNSNNNNNSNNNSSSNNSNISNNTSNKLYIISSKFISIHSNSNNHNSSSNNNNIINNNNSSKPNHNNSNKLRNETTNLSAVMTLNSDPMVTESWTKVAKNAISCLGHPPSSNFTLPRHTTARPLNASSATSCSFKSTTS